MRSDTLTHVGAHTSITEVPGQISLGPGQSGCCLPTDTVGAVLPHPRCPPLAPSGKVKPFQLYSVQGQPHEPSRPSSLATAATQIRRRVSNPDSRPSWERPYCFLKPWQPKPTRRRAGTSGSCSPHPAATPFRPHFEKAVSLPRLPRNHFCQMLTRHWPTLGTAEDNQASRILASVSSEQDPLQGP